MCYYPIHEQAQPFHCWHSLYGTCIYCNQCPKRHLEHTKLAEVIESKGLIFLKNIKTKWISMLAPFNLNE